MLWEGRDGVLITYIVLFLLEVPPASPVPLSPGSRWLYISLASGSSLPPFPKPGPQESAPCLPCILSSPPCVLREGWQGPVVPTCSWSRRADVPGDMRQLIISQILWCFFLCYTHFSLPWGPLHPTSCTQGMLP